METIICKTCGQEKPEGEFRYKGDKRSPALCNKCFKDRKRKIDRTYKQKPETKEKRSVYLKKPEVVERNISYRHKPEIAERNRERSREYTQRLGYLDELRSYRQRPSVRQRRLSKIRDAVYECKDVYIKYLITKRLSGLLKAKDIPTELIELQRQSLILKRTIKQKNKKNEQHTATDI